MSNSKFKFTKAHYFNQKLNESNNQLNNELKNKITNQFKLFMNEHKKINIEYDLKNDISFKYIQVQLTNLNNTYPNFTQEPIQIESDFIQDELIHQSLLEKSWLTLATFSKEQITTFLFNKICIGLGWFVL